MEHDTALEQAKKKRAAEKAREEAEKAAQAVDGVDVDVLQGRSGLWLKRMELLARMRRERG